MPGVETSAIALRGDYAQSLHQAGFELDPLDVQYGKFKFTNMDATGHLDSTSGLKFRISSALMENEGKSQFRNLNMEGTANEGCADYNLKLTDRSGLYQIDLTARSEVFRDSITIFPANSKVVLANEIWQISNDSRITYLNDGSILCKDLYLDGKDHYVNANGVISERNQDTLLLDFGNFRFDDLSPFLTESSLDSLEGKLNGSVMVTGLLGDPHFTGDVAARNLRYYSTDFGG